MPQYSDTGRSARRRGGAGLLAWPVLVFLGTTAVAVAYIAYVLWPRWPGVPVSLDAPSIPITIAGETFNIEPAAIRQSVQRRPGTQQRVDLAYLWPSLTPPDPAHKPTVGAPVNPNDRLFITITHDDGSLPPLERLKTIYPRYLMDDPRNGPEGLTVRGFRDGSPYQGEDLVIDTEAPEHFSARCTRSGVGNTGICLYDRRIGGATVTARFQRDWLADWQTTAHSIERLLTRLRPGGNDSLKRSGS